MPLAALSVADAQACVNCSISFTDSALQVQAQQLATQLQLPVATLDPQQLQLVFSPQRLELRLSSVGGPVYIDFTAGKSAHRRRFGGGRGQPLAKAVGLKQGQTPSVIDATAGLAGDAFVLASLGCTILLIEKNPLLACLIDDALQRSLQDSEAAVIVKRMQLRHGDAITVLGQLPAAQQPDVVYMDPMYPARDKSALVKKEMQLLHQLVGADSDSGQLLSVARQVARKRVVVKRPKGAAWVGEIPAAASVASKNTRYDIYLPL